MMTQENKHNKPYIAITIGPILRTMNLTTSPAALWASSYLFSFIARRLIAGINEAYEKNGFMVQYITPYEKKDDRKEFGYINRNDGVGILHDHIIFERPNDFSFKTLNEIRDNAIKEACKLFLNSKDPKDISYLQQYIMVSAVSYDAANPITTSSKMLDCLELSTAFVSEEKENPILAYFTNEGNDEGRNTQIRNSGIRLGIDCFKWQLLEKNGGKIRDLQSIANGGEKNSPWKKHDYYAIVRSDGDNMGKTIAQLEKVEDFHSFSDACLRYCDAVSKLVHEYNGMTVYAGGDDLLAVLPCEEPSGKNTVLHFVRDANQVFDGIFNSKDGFYKTFYNKQTPEKQAQLKTPSLTYGITMCHYKYPLYEALTDSAGLLFGAKKQEEEGYKNSVHMRLIKHSGQTSTVYIHNDALKENSKLLDLLEKICSQTDAQEKQILLSALHTIDRFNMLFNNAESQVTVDNLFKNTFDADAHRQNDFLHKTLPEIYGQLVLGLDQKTPMICALENGKKQKLKEDNQKTDAAAALYQLLRIFKFFAEKAGEKE